MAVLIGEIGIEGSSIVLTRASSSTWSCGGSMQEILSKSKATIGYMYVAGT